jgi:hypothetical protein
MALSGQAVRLRMVVNRYCGWLQSGVRSAENAEMEAGSALQDVPRSTVEEAELLRSRPPGWEYLLWGGVLLRRLQELEPKWQAHTQRQRRPAAREMSEREALDEIGSSRTFERALAIISEATAGVKSPETQEQAFGKLGEAGDPDKITALATSLIGGYEGLLEWSAQLRAEGVPPRFRKIYDAVSDLADMPLQQYRDYVNRVVAEFDKLPEALRDGKEITLELKLTLTIDEASQSRLQAELDAAVQKMELETNQLKAQVAAVDAKLRNVEPAVMAKVPVPQGLGFFEKRRVKKAIDQFGKEFAVWSAERDECIERLALAQTYQGESSTQIVLTKGEALFASVSGAALIEDRRGAGQWQGRSSGFSFPVGSVGGRTIRYRTGSSRGHFVQGAPVPTAVDVGTLYITNQRAVFQGAKQTRECRFDKLIGFQHTADGSTIFSVSNRQKPTQVHYGSALTGWVDFRLDLALAHYQGTIDALVAQLEADVATINAVRPEQPAMP